MADSSPQWPNTLWHRALRVVLIAVGTLSVALGVIGVFLPLLPTTPFLLLAAACYTRGSPRLYRWLISNRLFGPYLRNYYAGKGLPRSAKISVLILLWVTISLSAWLAVPERFWWVRLLLLAIALGVTTHILRLNSHVDAGGK